MYRTIYGLFLYIWFSQNASGNITELESTKLPAYESRNCDMLYYESLKQASFKLQLTDLFDANNAFSFSGLDTEVTQITISKLSNHSHYFWEQRSIIYYPGLPEPKNDYITMLRKLIPDYKTTRVRYYLITLLITPIKKFTY